MLADVIIALTWLSLFLLTFSLLALLIVRWLMGWDDLEWNPSEVGAAMVGCMGGGTLAWVCLLIWEPTNDPLNYLGIIFFGGFVGALLACWSWHRRL